MFKQKHVVLTGATSGIGIETAKLLLSEGASVIGIGSSDKSCAKAYKKLADLNRNIQSVSYTHLTLPTKA